MYQKLFKTTGLLLLAGLIMPAGMLLANEPYKAPALTSNTANWYNVDQASNLFNQMNTLALKVRREVARIHAQGSQLYWQAQSARLARAKYDINTIGNDLEQLTEMKTRLEPWQQSLLNKITPKVHEMVYQTDKALKTLSEHENRTVLAMTQYPQNIHQIYKNANQMSDTISTVTQYARAEQKMAELNRMNGAKAGS